MTPTSAHRGDSEPTAHRKTEQERAEEALGVAQRRVDRTAAKLTTAKAEVENLERELKALTARRDFLARDPALPQADDETLADAHPTDDPGDVPPFDEGVVEIDEAIS